MQVGRPPDGFRIIVAEPVRRYVTAEIGENARIERLWDDLLSRVKFTALREGTPLRSQGPPRFTLIAEGDPGSRIPTIQIVYECFGDTLMLTAALVWQESDHQSE